MGPLRKRQIGWLVVAAALLVGAGALRARLATLADRHELYIEAAGQMQMPLVRSLPGGLRALAFNYAWIRSQEQHQAGRHYDASQLASLACNLMPTFPGVWSFHAWNMAWNISVTTHTDQERWHWVGQGLRLLRDQGIPHNRKALLLYKELGWIYFFKMGQSLDESHPYYKQQWAVEMQQLLGAPPFGLTADVIDAFRPIAEAPLDKTFRRQGRPVIQPEQRDKVLADPAVADYVRLLNARGIGFDAGLLVVYNRYSNDPGVASVRAEPPELATQADEELSALINSPEHAAARGKMLAFIRAQMLWNVYKMDPQWMLEMMISYNAPFDWRMVYPHGLYWITYGLHICESRGMDDITTVNTDRIAMFCLRMLIWRGKLIYQEQPRKPDEPLLSYLLDLRYIDATQQEYLKSVNEVMDAARQRGESPVFERNIFRAGHVSFLEDAITTLFIAYQRPQAQELFDWGKENYHPGGMEWQMPLEEFVVSLLNKPGHLTADLAQSHVNAAIFAALKQLAQRRNEDFAISFAYAQKVYDSFAAQSSQGMDLHPMEFTLAATAVELLVRPGVFGEEMTLLDRSWLYEAMETRFPGIQAYIYNDLAPRLRPQCEQEGIDFDKAFPIPSELRSPGNAAP